MGLFSRTADVPALATKRDFEGLVKALNDEDTREEAMDAIVALSDPATVAPLVKLASRRYQNGAAAETVKRLGPQVVLEPLIKLCAEGSGVAVVMMYLLGEEAALNPLLELSAHERSDVAHNAYRGLFMLDTPKALTAVAEGLNGGPNQREALLAVQVNWQGAEPEMIRASFAPLRVEPDQLDDETTERVSHILTKLVERIRKGEVGSDEPIATFVDLLKDRADHVRLMAAMMLNQSLPEDGLDQPDPRMAEALEDACADELEGVRYMAADALARQGDPQALGHLMKLLDSEDEEVLVRAAKSIRMIAEKSGLPEGEGKRIVARYEEEGVGTKLGQGLAATAGLVKQKARAERKAASKNRG